MVVIQVSDHPTTIAKEYFTTIIYDYIIKLINTLADTYFTKCNCKHFQVAIVT